MDQSFSGTAAAIVFLACTAASLLLTVAWAVSSHRPVRRRAHLTGRAADPYWHSPTGLQDERGIWSRPRPQE
jgi:hypothetical protein